MSGEGLPLQQGQEASDRNMGQQLPFQSAHVIAGNSEQAQWSQEWTNIGSGGGDLEVFFFKHDNKFHPS